MNPCYLFYRSVSTLWRPALLVLLLPLLAACRVPGQSEEEALPFGTIEREVWLGTGEVWESEEPGVVVVTSAAETTRLAGFVAQDALTQVRKVDFGHYFVIVVFLGLTGHIPDGIEIRAVQHYENVVSVEVQVGDLTGALEVTSPYHAVQVQKTGEWNREIDFIVLFDGKQAVSQSYFIP